MKPFDRREKIGWPLLMVALGFIGLAVLCLVREEAYVPPGRVGSGTHFTKIENPRGFALVVGWYLLFGGACYFLALYQPRRSNR